MMQATPSHQPIPDRFDEEVDLLVIGAGPAGMTTALVAKLEGLEVMLCEKTDQIGGTAATSAGTLWIPENQMSEAAGFHDTADAAATYMDNLIGSDTNRFLREAYLSTGPMVIEYLQAHTDVQFEACGIHPDYQDRPGAAISGRAIVPKIFDGRRLGKDFARVRPPMPEFMIFGGMMVGKADIPPLLGRFKSVSNFFQTAKLLTRYLMDRLSHARGTRVVMGNALVARLFFSLRKAGQPVQFDTKLNHLICEDGVVYGARIEGPNGSRTIRARRGVVLATGGFAHNKQLRDELMPAPMPERSLAAPGDSGDGIQIARALNARVSPENHGTGAFWTPVSETKRKDGSTGLFPHLSLDRAKPGLIAVNKAGARFVNEANSYHDFVKAMYTANETVPSIPSWLICEERFVQKYGLGVIYPGTQNITPFVKNGYVERAASIDALSRQIGVDPVGLRDTLTRYNSDCELGVDRDFGKGTTELNRFNGDPSVTPNPCLAPIQRGPFVAVKVWPAEIACSTGVDTNADGAVLDTNGTAIAGLFACGNDMASIMTGTYPGPGTTLGPAIVFGYRIAQSARKNQANVLPAQ